MSGAPSFIRSYETSYAGNVVEFRSSGSTPIQMHRLRQPAGIYHVPVDGDLTISLGLNGGFNAELDVGAGRFRRRWRANEFALVAPCRTEARFDLDDDLDALNLSVPFSRVQPIIEEASGDCRHDVFAPLHVQGNHDPFVVTLMQELWSELADASPRGTLFADHALTLLIARLLRLAQLPQEQVRGGLADWQLRRVAEWLETHLCENVTLVELASLVGLSAFHFARMFKRSQGVPPHSFQRQLRIVNAKRLMREGHLPLVEVAAVCGFASQQHFTTAFKRETGTTPAVWRRERNG